MKPIYAMMIIMAFVLTVHCSKDYSLIKEDPYTMYDTAYANVELGDG